LDRTEIRKSEKAFLVGVLHGNQTAEIVKEHLSELKQLAETAGLKLSGKSPKTCAKLILNILSERVKHGKLLNRQKPWMWN